MIVTVIPGYLGQMTRLELVAWLRQREYDGPVSFPKSRLVEIALSLSSLGAAASYPSETVDSPETTTEGEIQPQSGFVRVLEWEGVTGSNDIRVKGDPGWYRFNALVTNPRTGSQWIDCYGGAGGANGHQRSRSFHLDRIRRKPNGQILTRIHRKKGDD